MAGPLNINDINDRFKQLSSQIEQFNKMQQNQQSGAPTPGSAPIEQVSSGPTYPKVFRKDTVEGILENPQWKQELAIEFNDSDLGAKAKAYTELLFMEFCEKQTGVSSTMLTEMRKQEKKNNKPAAPPKPEEAKG